MPVAVVVHGCGSEVPEAGISDLALDELLVLDAPKIVLGRGESCDVRLPHPSVSLRHAILASRGSEYVLTDDGSLNGTRTDGLLLSVAVPQRIDGRALFRLGKVWVELVECSAPPTRNAREKAKEIALGLVSAELEAHGEDGRPVVTVEAGPDAGSSFVVERSVVVGRSQDVEVSLSDTDVSRRHLEITRRGDALVVRDLGSKAGSMLADEPLGTKDVIWRPGQSLVLGGTSLTFAFPGAEALKERERAPEMKTAHAELDYSPPAPTPPPSEPAPVTETPVSAPEEDFEEHRPRYRGTSWNVTDFAVALLAVGVCSLSAVGYLVLLR